MTAKESKAVARFNPAEDDRGVCYGMDERSHGEWVNLAEYQAIESALHAAEAELGELRRRVRVMAEIIGGSLGRGAMVMTRRRWANELKLLASDGGADGDNEGDSNA